MRAAYGHAAYGRRGHAALARRRALRATGLFGCWLAHAQAPPAFAALSDYKTELFVESGSAAFDFRRDEEGRYVVAVSVEARVVMQCQRCLSDMEVAVESASLMACVWSDEEAAALPATYEPLLVDAAADAHVRLVAAASLRLVTRSALAGAPRQPWRHLRRGRIGEAAIEPARVESRKRIRPVTAAVAAGR